MLVNTYCSTREAEPVEANIHINTGAVSLACSQSICCARQKSSIGDDLKVKGEAMRAEPERQTLMV